jgi:hypothetical protein
LVFFTLLMRDRYAAATIGLLVAAGGLLLATLLSQGGFSSRGEGGRLLYGPACWFALAIGVAASATATVRSSIYRMAVTSLFVATFLGAYALHHVLIQVLDIERQSKAIVVGVEEISSNSAHHNFVLLPESINFVVLARNAQGAMCMPPLQRRALMHRALLTLNSEVASRYDLYAGGFATNLIAHPPTRLDSGWLDRLLIPAAPIWPDGYFCWSSTTKSFQSFKAPRTDSQTHWTQDILESTRGLCGIES